MPDWVLYFKSVIGLEMRDFADPQHMIISSRSPCCITSPVCWSVIRWGQCWAHTRALARLWRWTPQWVWWRVRSCVHRVTPDGHKLCRAASRSSLLQSCWDSSRRQRSRHSAEPERLWPVLLYFQRSSVWMPVLFVWRLRKLLFAKKQPTHDLNEQNHS